MYLQDVDDALQAEAKPARWQSVGKRRRTIMTPPGEVRVKQRLYRDEAGPGCFLLDKYSEPLAPRA